MDNSSQFVDDLMSPQSAEPAALTILARQTADPPVVNSHRRHAFDDAKGQVTRILGRPCAPSAAGPVNGAERLLSGHEANTMLL